MKHWIDPKTGCKMCEPDSADEWLALIWMVGFDYDGCESVSSLKALVDELIQYAQNARECLHDGKLFATE